jgi:glycosyltransferase involved in cell wall biosynthesis
LNLLFLDPLVAGVRVVATRMVDAILRAAVDGCGWRFRLFTTRRGESCLRDDARARDAASRMGSRLEVEIVPVDPRHKAARFLLEQTRLARLASRVDVMHSFDYTFPYLAPTRNIVTIHDLNYLNHPGTFSFSQRAIRRVTVPLSLRLADRVVTISETARTEILARFPVDSDRVVVISNGYAALESRAPQEGREDEARNGPYLLSVGTLKVHKNYPRLLEAFAALPVDGLRLVIVGRDDGMSGELVRRAAALGVLERVTLCGFLSEQDLRRYYRGATVFVAPSLYEGFGMPVLEAMAHGAPVACSDLAVFREIAGEAAAYFDPLDPESIRATVAAVLKDSGRRARLVGAGLERAARFTWDSSARKALRLYGELSGASAAPCS